MKTFRNFFDKSPGPSALDKAVAEAAAAMGTRQTDDPVPEGMAKDMLVSLLYLSADLLAQNRQAERSSALFEFASRLVGDDWEKMLKEEGLGRLTAHAERLLQSGRFSQARKLFEFLAEKDPSNTEVHTNLAALYHEFDPDIDAKAFLTDFFQRHPVQTVPATHNVKTATTLLCMTGYDKTRFRLGRRQNGQYFRFRRGGHFLLKHLLDQQNYTIDYYTIAEDNIAKCLPDRPTALMLNIMAEADIEHTSLTSLCHYLEAHPGMSVFNHPAEVLKTTRDGNYDRLNQIAGIRFPRTERFTLGETSPVLLAQTIENRGFSYPFIIRETGTHTARSTCLVADRTELDDYLTNTGGDTVYAIEFIENASAEGHYTKMRFFSIDGKLYPVVHHIDQVWNVHGGNRKTFMAGHDWMIEREKQFLADPAAVIGPKAYALLQSLPDLIKLDFFGFDFTLLPDGTILIFELNAAMRHSFSHAETFRYMQPYMENITDAFQAMVRARVARNAAAKAG